MKNKLLVILGSIVIVLIATFGIRYLLSLHRVAFTLYSESTGAVIYNSDKQKVKLINQGSRILLTDGKYYAVPEGDKLAKTPIHFTVDKKDMTVTIDPAYSDDYLKKLLTKEESAIMAAISTKYPSVFSNYTLSKQTLYNRGEWFGALLKPKVDGTRDRRDPYRVVLQKKGDTWELIRRPEYILTSSRYENVPIEILRSINSIVE